MGAEIAGDVVSLRRIRESLTVWGVNGGSAGLFWTCCLSRWWLADQSARLESNGGDTSALSSGAGVGKQVANCESRGPTNRHFGARP